MKYKRPLHGCTVGISISPSDDAARLGFDNAEINRGVVLISEALLGAGARLAFGHDWRPGGVMEAVTGVAVRYFDPPMAPVADMSEMLPPIINLIAPPDSPYLAGKDLEDYKLSLRL